MFYVNACFDSVQVMRRNRADDFKGAHNAANGVEKWIVITHRVSLVFYTILVLLLVGLVVSALLVGIDAAHKGT